MNTTPSSNNEPSPGPVAIGDRFPDVELIDHTGASWKPSDANGKPLVLILHRHLA